jgi:hypothetical protein
MKNKENIKSSQNMVNLLSKGISLRQIFEKSGRKNEVRIDLKILVKGTAKN